MLPHLGETRSSLKSDHLLQTPDTFIRTPLPGGEDVDFIVHAGPRLGANFTMMTAEFRLGGRLPVLTPGIERFVYVLEGDVELDRPFETTILKSGGFAYLPPNTPHAFEAKTAARAVVIEKTYQPKTGSRKPEVSFGQEQDLPSEPLGGDPGLLVKRMMPDGVPYDFAVNTMTYDPGASLAMVEVHVMEHGLLMLEGGGIYRLGDHWYPTAAGDFIWMAPYCPQWFGALGKTPAKYVIYKDWYRHPLGE